jgi:hypothetical protein
MLSSLLTRNEITLRPDSEKKAIRLNLLESPSRRFQSTRNSPVGGLSRGELLLP